jgi:hypothetical protein
VVAQKTASYQNTLLHQSPISQTDFNRILHLLYNYGRANYVPHGTLPVAAGYHPLLERGDCNRTAVFPVGNLISLICVACKLPEVAPVSILATILISPKSGKLTFSKAPIIFFTTIILTYLYIFTS